MRRSAARRQPAVIIEEYASAALAPREQPFESPGFRPANISTFVPQSRSSDGGGIFRVDVVDELAFSAPFRTGDLVALETFWKHSRHSAQSCENTEEFGEGWLRGRDLNPRPLGYEPNELPDCSTPRHCEEH